MRAFIGWVLMFGAAVVGTRANGNTVLLVHAYLCVIAGAWLIATWMFGVRRGD